MANNANNSDTIKQLNSFLRGELSAVETYRQAIEKLQDEPSIRAQLADFQASHQRRVGLLSDEIRRLGGAPDTQSGVWGSFAKLVEGSAALFGKKAAISALEEGEDHGRDDYRRDLDDVAPDVRSFLQQHIIPEQERTHNQLSRVQSQM